MTEISFVVPAVPVSQPRQKHRIVQAGGRAFAQNYLEKSHPVNEFKASVRRSAADAYSGPPLDSPLSIVLVFVFPRPANMRWKTKPMPRAPYLGTKDIDNLQKSVFDALNHRLFCDDRQIVRVAAEKVVAAGDEQPHVEVLIKELGT